MTLYEQIKSIYPQLTDVDFFPITGTILLQDDSDGKGAYIKSWNHTEYAQPTEEQLKGVA